MAQEALESTTDGTNPHAKWVTEIRMYEREAEKWHERGKRIIRRYKDERTTAYDEDGKRRYNILYSNVQTLLPAYFSRTPKPDIERRFKDQDDVGRIAAEVWERSTTYFVEHGHFSHSIKQAVMDRLLPGRGIVWMRYVPHMRDIQITSNPEEGPEITEDVYTEPTQEVYYEEVCPDYVNWQDFLHNVSRTWEEVWWVGRKVYMEREAGIKRFGDKFKTVPLDYSPRGLNDEKIADDMKKATVYEIWDKNKKKAVWLHKDYPELLDEIDDPLNLDDFFPCPRPLFPTMTNDSCFPVPDYAQYQDQAKELDDLTGRIAALTKAIKVAGVYDSSAAGVERLLSEGVENRLVPIAQWAVFGEKGGLKGVMDFLPLEQIMQALLGLYEAREKVKADLYEITGIADIVRGATKASETATAQNIKGQYAALRLDDGQQAVQRFARDLVRIIAQIIANHFSLETIKMISGVKLLTAQEKQQVQMQYAPKPPMPGQPPAPPPKMPEELEELMYNPTWEEVGALLKDNAMRTFRIDIETDSTLKADQEAEKQARVEFLTASGGFIDKAAKVAQLQPALSPLLMEMLMFGVRAFPVGKQLETTFEVAKQKLAKEQEAAENAPPKPDPEMQKIQMQGQLKQQEMQMDMQVKQQQAQVDQQKEAAETQQEQQRLSMQAEVDKNQAMLDMQLDAQKHSEEQTLKLQIAEMDNRTKIICAEIAAKAQIDLAAAKLPEEDMIPANDEEAIMGKASEIQKTRDQDAQQRQAIIDGMQGIQQMLSELTAAIKQPKTVKYDANGNVAGVH